MPTGAEAEEYPSSAPKLPRNATTRAVFPGVTRGHRWREGQPYHSGSQHPRGQKDWQEHHYRRIRWATELVEALPTLHGRLAGSGFDYDVVAGWLAEPWASSTATQSAIAFVLMVWTGRGELVDEDEPETSWRFDACTALGAWDRHHRAVFGAWAADPWWL